MLKNLPVLAGLSLLALPGAAYAATPRFDRLYVFGDSYSDSGAGYVDSNGPTAVAYLAQALDIPFTWAGAPDAADKGLNFAVSSAQTGSRAGYYVRPVTAPRGTHEAILGRGMRNQVDDFLARNQARRIVWHSGSTLFFLAGGLNDGTLPTSTTIDNLSGEIRDLHAAGGRNFVVALLPTQIPAFSAVGTRLNPALTQMVADLAREFSDSKIVASNWGHDFDDIFSSPETYGITDTQTSCAKREIFGEDPKPCADPQAHFFYHDMHPSTRVHAIVGEKVAAEIREDFGISSH